MLNGDLSATGGPLSCLCDKKVSLEANVTAKLNISLAFSMVLLHTRIAFIIRVSVIHPSSICKMHFLRNCQRN